MACTFAHLTYCSHFALGNPKSFFSTVLFIRTSDYLRYLRRKQTVTALPTTADKCHGATLQNAQLFHLTEVCCIPLNVGGSKKSRLWGGIGGSEKNQL